MSSSQYLPTGDICSTATFKTLDEAVDHESTCTGAPASDTALCMEVKNRVSPANPTEEWWASFAERARQSEMDIKSIANGGKIVVLLQLLGKIGPITCCFCVCAGNMHPLRHMFFISSFYKAHCDNIGDKVVVFSQCLRTLNFIEEILQSPDWGGFNPYFKSGDGQKLGGWRKNMEYLRIDGSVDSKERGELISTFNSTEIQHCKLFLLSIKAGGLG